MPGREDLFSYRFNWKSYNINFKWYICEPDGASLTGSTIICSYVFDSFNPWIVIRYYDGLPLGLDEDNMGEKIKGIEMAIPNRNK